MAARLVTEAFATLALTGRSVTAEDVFRDATSSRRLEESLTTLVAVLAEP